MVGDSPAVHTSRFKAEKSGIQRVCEITGAEWIDFMADPVELSLKKGKIRIAAITQTG